MAKKEVSQAAEKVAAAEKKKDKKPANPNGNIFVRAGKAIKKFCKDIKGEVKKIVWPDAKTVLKSTGIVLAVVIVCALIIFLIDQLLAGGLSLLERAAESIGSAGEATTAANTVATTVANAVTDHGDHTHVAGLINFIG
ncbi:MAG: preprotein translocase subunit SecE [Clostridia bacterium]|nr:preprotein translocase subunit SecE [Clostridia bacterium]